MTANALKEQDRIGWNGTIEADPAGNFSPFAVTPGDPKVSAWVQTVLQFAPAPSVSLQPDFEMWARETHDLGCRTAYGKLPGSVETTPRTLSAQYVKGARTLARSRLCFAGYRLAALLNELYP